MTTITTTEMIAELAMAIHGDNASSREKYVLNQALLALVELARAEYRVELLQRTTVARQLEAPDKSASQVPRVLRRAATSTLH